jgi:hypothetical protein
MSESSEHELVDWKLGVMLLPLPSKTDKQQYVLLYNNQQYKVFRKWDTAVDFYNKLRKTIKQNQTKGPLS